MKISRLLERHLSAVHPTGLINNFGDTFLCQNNKIFKNVRSEALKLGFLFSNEQNDAYQALPLSQLASILSTKKIPYLNNVSVLKELEKQISNVADWDDINDNFKKNFLFHESCHAVARVYSKDIKIEDRVLVMLMEESFANTCELLAVVEVNEAAHKIFYEWNSYTALFDSKSNLKSALLEIGSDILSKIIFFGYLHSNLLFDTMDEKQLGRILKIVSKREFSAKQIKTIKSLIKICFTLDYRFKEVTTRFYMRLNGLTQNLDKRISLNYIDKFENNAELGLFLDKLILVVTA